MTMMSSAKQAAATRSDAGLDEEFADHVMRGLSLSQKTLSSRYLYDAAGSALFARITELPEYYLSRSETQIIEQYSSAIFTELNADSLDIVELGSGSGEKTVLLLQAALASGIELDYHPMDISPAAIRQLSEDLQRRLPALQVNGIHANYHERLGSLSAIGEQQKTLVMFLGSNIGNYDTHEADNLLSGIARGLNSGDFLLIGFDMVKSYQRMIAAYNDAQGVTAEFNLNLLVRMNNELGANFDIEQFYHYEIYNPLDQAMQSFLVSRQDQRVEFSAVDFAADFAKNEALYMESSRKYTQQDIASFAARNGFVLTHNYSDDNGDFIDSLWQRE